VSKASRQLDADRAARDQARQRLDSRLDKARQDMTPNAIAGRLAGEFKRKARDAAREAVEIADGNRAVVAGTIGALALWFLRRPILSWLGEKLAGHGQTEDDADDEA